MARKRPGVALTDKQRMFCNEYVIDLHATNAAIRAGYSEDSARSTASHLLDNADIQDYVRKLQDDKFWRLRITAENVLAELAKIGFAEIEDYVGEEEFVVAVGRQTTDDGRQRNTDDGGANTVDDGPQTTDDRIANIVDDGPQTTDDGGANTGDEGTGEVKTMAASTAKQRAALSYKRVVVDPVTGRRTTITFSLYHKIMALRIIGMHLGLFVRDKGKYKMELPILITPKGRPR